MLLIKEYFMKYEIKDDSSPVVICHLEKGETIISDNHAVSWKDPCIKMENGVNTINGFLGRLFPKKTGSRHIHTATQDGMIAFNASFPGNIMAVDVECDKELIIQKSAFLACEQSVSTSVFFNSGLLSNDGLRLTKLSGQGICFIKIDGSIAEYNLLPGQQIVVDYDKIAMMEATCKMKIQAVSPLKKRLSHNNESCHTVITGPGRLLLQTIPVFTMTNNLYSCFSGGQ